MLRSGWGLGSCLVLGALITWGCSGKVLTAERDNAGGSGGVAGTAGSSAPAAGESGEVGTAGAGGSAGAGGEVETEDPGVIDSGMGGSAGDGAGGNASAMAGEGGAAGESSYPPDEVLLRPKNSYVYADSNSLQIHGYILPSSDAWAMLGGDFTGSNVCVRGMIVACPDKTESDCADRNFGVTIGFYLIEPLDPTVSVEAPFQPFNARRLRGFAFDLVGDAVPSEILNFGVNTKTEFFCSAANQAQAGSNVMLFSELAPCGRTPPTSSIETAKASLIQISWTMRPNAVDPVPFDFCIANIRALLVK